MAKTRKGEETGSSDSEVRDDPALRLDKASLATKEPEAESTTEATGTQELGVEYATAPGADELNARLAQTGGDNDPNADLGLEPSTKKDRDDSEFTDDGDDSGDGIVSFEDRMNLGKPDGFQEHFGSGFADDGSGDSGGTFGGSGRAGQYTNPITGEGESDSMSSFTDYAETKTGRDESLDTDQGPTGGASVEYDPTLDHSTFGGRVGWVRSSEPGKVAGGTLDVRTVDGSAEYRETFIMEDKQAGTTTVAKVHYGDAIGSSTQTTEVHKSGTIITTTTDADGTVTKEGSYPDGSPIEFKNPAGNDAAHIQRVNEVTKSSGTDGKGVKDPGPDGEQRVPLDEKVNDSLFRQYQESKNAGGGGDGATDPIEHEDSVVLDGAVTRAEMDAERVGQFGQPADEGFTGEREPGDEIPRDWNDDNMGALDPAEGFGVGGGSKITENEADAVTTRDPMAGMPADDAHEETATDDGGDGSSLPPGDFRLADPRPDLSDIDAGGFGTGAGGQGAIDPTGEEDIGGGSQRAEDPVDDTSDSGESVLPNYDILGPVDDPTAEVPDVDVADAP